MEHCCQILCKWCGLTQKVNKKLKKKKDMKSLVEFIRESKKCKKNTHKFDKARFIKTLADIRAGKFKPADPKLDKAIDKRLAKKIKLFKESLNDHDLKDIISDWKYEVEDVIGGFNGWRQSWDSYEEAERDLENAEDWFDFTGVIDTFLNSLREDEDYDLSEADLSELRNKHLYDIIRDIANEYLEDAKYKFDDYSPYFDD